MTSSIDKYYVLGGKYSIMEEHVFIREDEMLEYVRRHAQNNEGVLPDVYYGHKLQFEPAIIIQSFKVKEQP